jgi:small subunit ribosomal protein S17
MKKSFIGNVTSDKMQKTIVVVVTDLVKHPLYKKYIKKIKKYKVHDENNSAKIGDKVLFAETRPLSKDKCWSLKKILEKVS